MSAVSHLKSLQAVEMAVRTGSLKDAAQELGITPAAVGQRIRAIEDYLGTDLLMRGRSGLKPTVELLHALDDLRTAFAALERASDALDFQRTLEIHIVADPDWAELWLLRRLDRFREAHPNILFCVNGTGDVPLRLGSPDIRVLRGPGEGEPLFNEVFLPVTGPDNPRRIADYDSVHGLEGLPLLHIKPPPDGAAAPGWPDWFATFGHRKSAPDRGFHYQHARIAIDAARESVGFLLGPLSLVLDGLQDGQLLAPFPLEEHLTAADPYRVAVRSDAANRPQVQRFVGWLQDEAARTHSAMEAYLS
ncbi:LysR family transcriptional regulator [Ponticoccus sp. SC2-23]|uniref:LysR substrate-binding domain-containing protein n=1 Tax=Alexandriicola marinus TaxID=2081710 RepID=UPI000FD8794E|nr:LysR substrate-binding domain-containing protein [Alexandriicola marinus]MBM1221025.1 LysR family transcriptional regulator [Ponticoccus sp. SC6-9]MBM1225595.1 LysR family transcriptional regulator [Ponticoccus sp. SC6-15]MBM1227747.1 LysR family transcriptional regulator [Ponticoccus sp. SC6-38]MBM1234615.1 LysR family transcriptional regulator [Ponticoccus sp. SC6-45]MBM1238249.1 LysR family transcriptional regulator [Ponticoccus sp. SC6-49]MBM1243518.1 LysR family transcriptional regula